MRRMMRLAACLLLCSGAAQAQSEDAPATEAGQDLDLFGVLETFSESEDLEDFEKRLNDPDMGLNNMDLNQDE